MSGGFNMASNIAISKLTQCGNYESIISLFQVKMSKKGILPDGLTLSNLIQNEISL